MAEFDRVLLYIGAPKTGTTSIQSFLWTNRVALIKQGFYVPKAGRRGAQHMDLPATLDAGKRNSGLDRHADIRDDNLQARKTQFRAGLDEELSQAPPCHTLLFMSEYMFSSARRHTDAYRVFSSRYAPRLESLMYLRRQDQWLTSLTLQTIKSGARSSLRLNPGSPEQYAGSIRTWDSESDHCYIRRFDSEFLLNGNLIEDFCNTIGADTTNLSTREDHANPAILQEQLELMDALNEKLAAISFWRRIPYRRGFIPLCTEVIGGTKIEFPRAAAQAAFAGFKGINTWLHDTRDPEGPPLFFNTDFSKYEEAPTNDRCYKLEQLAHLVSVISQQFKDQGLSPLPVPDAGSRAAMIDYIVSAYLPLRDAQLRVSRRALKATRRAAEQALYFELDRAPERTASATSLA
jgi:hypothetical protein